MLVCVFVCAFGTRDRGCSTHPVFPAPSDFREREFDGKPRAEHAARSRSRVGGMRCLELIRDNSSGGASWFETRAAALLTMRVQDLVLQRRRPGPRPADEGRDLILRRREAPS